MQFGRCLFCLPAVLLLLLCCFIARTAAAVSPDPVPDAQAAGASDAAAAASPAGDSSNNSGDVFVGADGGEIRRFTINVSDAALSTLRTKLSLTDLPDADDEPDPSRAWERGINLRYLSSLIDYWRTQYDWREREREFNKLDHFTTQIDEYSVHFVHARSPRADAIPLLFVHGWPGSFLECVRILPLLTHPPNASTPAFHVVCPSLPGYGYSSARSGLHTTTRDAAALFVRLMARLDYGRYVAQGGDWGAFVVTQVAILDPEHCRGLHLNAAPTGPPLALFATHNPVYALWRSVNTVLDFLLPYHWRFPAAEAAILEWRGLEWMVEQTGYFHQQSTRPDSLGVGLHDSPAGLAAWLAEKLRAWADTRGHGDIERVFSKQDVLDHVSLYYFSRSITSSMRLYYETLHAGFIRDINSFHVEQPTAFAAFPAELLFAPRKWLEDFFPNLVRYTVQKEGGHFAAMEQPELLVEDVRHFVAENVLPVNWKPLQPQPQQQQQQEATGGAELKNEL